MAGNGKIYPISQRPEVQAAVANANYTGTANPNIVEDSKAEAAALEAALDGRILTPEMLDANTISRITGIDSFDKKQLNLADSDDRAKFFNDLMDYRKNNPEAYAILADNYYNESIAVQGYQEFINPDIASINVVEKGGTNNLAVALNTQGVSTPFNKSTVSIEQIQQLAMQRVGYDPAMGTPQVQRMDNGNFQVIYTPIQMGYQTELQKINSDIATGNKTYDSLMMEINPEYVPSINPNVDITKVGLDTQRGMNPANTTARPQNNQVAPIGLARLRLQEDDNG